jgi:uncharacterized membrane protein (UPF0127 family)
MSGRRIIAACLVTAGVVAACRARVIFPSNVATVRLPDGATLRATIVDSDEERRVGLSETVRLDSDEGMLFLLDEPAVPAFWMKGMRFAIDVVWIADGEVVGVESSVPVPSPGDGDADLPRYAPAVPVDMVLETNAGFARAHGLAVGSLLDIEVP